MKTEIQERNNHPGLTRSTAWGFIQYLRAFQAILFIGFFLYSGSAYGKEAFDHTIRNLYGKIKSLRGEASLNGGAMTVGMRVYRGDFIETDRGKVEIKSGKSFFSIGPFSKIELGIPLSQNRSYIRLLKGSLKSIINKILSHNKNIGYSFQVKTPTVVTGVRGTEFIMHATPKAGVIFTREGTVYFTSAGKTIPVSHMEMSQGGEDISPLASESVVKNDQLQQLMNEIEQFCNLEIPPSISAKVELNDIIARWNLNYSSYMVDKKEFQKARKLCALGFFIADLRSLKAESLLNKATISFRFMGEERTALEDFDVITESYGDTEYVEHALYYKGLIYYNLNESDKARMILDQYLNAYPEGRFKENAISIINNISNQ